MTKIVYNTRFGGFGLSHEAIVRYAELRGQPLAWEEDLGLKFYTLNGTFFLDCDIPRTDPHLIQVVEELGEKANGTCAYLALRELQPGTKYRIDEYDGNESVMTIDDYEWSVA